MAIRLRNRKGSITRLAASLSGVTAALVGDVNAPSVRTGTVRATLTDLASAFRGIFRPASNFTGPIAASFSGVSASVRGSFTAAGTFGWTIPVTPLQVPGPFYSLDPGKTYNVAQHVNDPQDIGVYTAVSQLKNNVAGNYGFTVDPNTGVVSVPANLPDPSASATDYYEVVVDVVPSVTPLGQVTGLAGTALITSVTLNWTSVAGATGYVVERSPSSGGAWTVVGTPAIAAYTDTGLSASTPYWYRVKAVNATQEGAYSTSLNLVTQPMAASGDFDSRASGSGVVWAHPFRTQEEFDKFAVMQGQQPPKGDDPYPLSAPATLVPKRVLDSSGLWCIEYINFGTLLAEPMDTVQTTMVLVDATDFPNPADHGMAGYRIAVKHEDNKNSSSLYERMFVTAKSGNVLTVMRNVNSDGSLMAHAAGSKVGYDSEGRWSRPFAAFTAPSNGKPAAPNGANDDPAASNTVPKRNWDQVIGATVAKKLDNFKAGYYTHADYRAKWPTTLPNGGGADASWWDGDEFYLQYRMKISAGRYQNGNEARASKKFFLWNCSNSGVAQIIGFLDAVNPAQGEVTSRWWWFHAYGDGRQGTGGTGSLTSPQGKRIGSSYQPGSAGEATCLVGSGQPLGGCWQWPVEEWVTVLIHLKAGHFGTVRAGENASDAIPKGSITVQGMTPINNGVDTLTLETNIIPDPDIWTFPGGGYISHGTNDYFKHWVGAIYTGVLANRTFRVDSYTNMGNGLARWVLKKNGNTWNTGVPAAGDQFGVSFGELFDDLAGSNPRLKYPDWQLDAWVARPGQPYVRVFGPPSNLPGYYLVFGNSYVGDFSKNPPGYSMFAPTAYQNLDVGSVPPSSRYSYKFTEIILSKDWIPPPT